jgi:hypothetical protein
MPVLKAGVIIRACSSYDTAEYNALHKLLERTTKKYDCSVGE